MHQFLTRIDLNCDLGEADTAERLDVERRVMAYVSSVNIACGSHAGTPDLMRRTIHLAKQYGLAIGAHPGLADREGYGRRETPLTPAAVETLVAHQVRALRAIADLETARLSHVKPHGALYNMAACDRSLAEAVARAIAAVDPRLILVGLADSELIRAGQAQGLPVAAEVFADRAYHQNGRLVARGSAGALIDKEQTIVLRVGRLAREGLLQSLEGPDLPVRADTLCLHADTPDAASLARVIRQTLTNAGVTVHRLDHARG